MTPRVRKLALTAHVVTSVGWLGAVAAFLALAVAGRTSDDAESVRSAYVAAEMVTWTVIVPLCFAALATGLVQALGTSWGLFRHYWVVAKLVLTVFATIVLLLQLGPIGHVADRSVGATSSTGDLHADRNSLILHAAGGLLVLLTTASLSVYKPPGRTRYGWRRQQGVRAPSRP